MKTILIALFVILFVTGCELQINKGFPNWDFKTTYSAGQGVEDGRDFFISTTNNNTGHDPRTSPQWWVEQLHF